MLNAKPEHAEREGEIVAEAGQPGAVTIATNMAGRGVDIKLGGNEEHLVKLELAGKLGWARTTPTTRSTPRRCCPRSRPGSRRDREVVMTAGGLFICGTERHESRRIDNQLRGRSGRQGDPGESRFFLSAEDDLVRLFAGDRIYRILDRLGTTDEEGNEEPIEAKMLTKQIEKAQRKVEEQNFLQPQARPRVRRRDEPAARGRLPLPRRGPRGPRHERQTAREEIAGAIERLVDEYTPGDFLEDWDLEGLFVRLEEIFPVSFGPEDIEAGSVDRDELVRLFAEDAHDLYDEREEELGDDIMRALERYILLDTIDAALARAPLRHGLPARGHPPARVRPDRADRRLQERGLRALHRPDEHHLVGLRADGLPRRGRDRRRRGPGGPVAPPATRPGSGSSTRSGSVSYSGGEAIDPRAAMAMAAAGAPEEMALDSLDGEAEEPPPVVQRRVEETEQIGRNDPCWCGSGKKFKKCHGA